MRLKGRKPKQTKQTNNDFDKQLYAVYLQNGVIFLNKKEQTKRRKKQRKKQHQGKRKQTIRDGWLTRSNA